ncbi:DinB family protein [Paraflavitalea sp. CAU 1676]|uniref:DinB family protein n=1 Tax=Paraflavitalea sp. CAU 1676 TaxID=3032598 RepID=UPI0023DA2DC1|nr:DinB family protein [Paraflavitalea sp. CAU 1676]MDF2193014.1 DinB family protein [Paraflavitalea sp. CAU 1676]
MNPIQSSKLLDQLSADTKQVILTLHYLLQTDPGILLQQPAAGKWSVAQVVEHLNSYGRYYLPLIQQALQTQSNKPSPLFKTGWLGNYFTKSMLPKEDGRIPNKMKAPKDHRPSPHVDSLATLKTFLEQEKLLLELLHQARANNLNKIRIPISIAKFITINLGDTFRFLIAHHQRHFVQIANTIEAVKGNQGYTFANGVVPS